MSRRWRVVTISVVVVALGAAAFIAQSEAQGVDGYVGVALGDISAQQAAGYGLSGPAVVAGGVVPNGPAYKAGLREGDAVTSVDGHNVTDAKTAADLLRAHRAGDKVRMGIVHIMGDGRRVEIELGIVAEPRPANYGLAPAQPGAPPSGTPPPAAGARPGGAAPGPSAALRLVDPQTVMQGFPQHQGHCSALLPQGWAMSAGQYGDTADIVGAGGRAHAAWGIRGINTAMRAYYGDMFGPPDAATLATAAVVAGAQARYTGPATGIGGYFTAQPFVAGNVVGTTLYHTYPGPAPGQYILSVFIAWVDRGATNLLPTAQAVMASISCQTQLRPVEMTSPPSRPGARGGSESDKLKDYNTQLGTQWVHSSTGRHYLMDYATQWNDNGPDGPGYYIKSGNSHEKLTPGW